MNFLETISQIIIEYHQKREFKAVTLVCPPHLIGGLRDKISLHLEEGDVKLIGKDFTHLNKDEIYKNLLNLGM